MDSIILVIGATGAMGRSVVRFLLGDNQNNWSVRIFTRNPKSRHACQLLEEGKGRVEAIEGDLNNADHIKAAMRGVYGVFCNTDFFSSASVRTEYEQGLRILEIARTAGVQYFVYSSLDSSVSISDGRIPLPHYDAKAAVEHWIDMQHSDEFMRKETEGWFSKHVTVLVTGPYFENLQSGFQPQKGRLSDGREGLIFNVASGGKPHPMVAIEDIAWFVQYLFNTQNEWGGRKLRILGEILTLAEVAQTFERVTGIPTEWQDVSLDSILKSGLPIAHDLANMHLFFQEYGVVRDFEMLRGIHPNLMTFEAWLDKTGWHGESVEVQKTDR